MEARRWQKQDLVRAESSKSRDTVRGARLGIDRHALCQKDSRVDPFKTSIPLQKTNPFIAVLFRLKIGTRIQLVDI